MARTNTKSTSLPANKILVIDVGGTNVKIAMGNTTELTKIPSGPAMTATQMASAVKKVAAGWGYEAVSIGFPGPVKDGRPAKEPVNLGGGWVRFDYGKAFGKPVRMINDAALQALGGYEGGRMLFLGLGTGLGSTLIVDGTVAPLEVAHLPYRKGDSYEDYVGERGLKRFGKKKWAHHVEKVIALLRHGLQAEYVVLGGGQTKRLTKLPDGVKLGTNVNAIRGGVRLWDN
jgi:polyphosphate glucokinase